MIGDPKKLLKQIKKGAKKEGVTFKGTVKKGTFSGKRIRGEYWLEGENLYLDSKSKTLLIPESYMITKITGGETGKNAHFKIGLITIIAISIVLILLVNQFPNFLKPVEYIEDKTILCIGDSLTSPGDSLTSLIPENDSVWNARYSIYLQDELGDAFKVVDKGYPGFTSADLIDSSVLNNSLISVNPGLVILLIGTNDIAHFNSSITIANIDSMVSEILNTGARLIIMTIPPSVIFDNLTLQNHRTEINSHIRNLHENHLLVYDLALAVCTSDYRVLEPSYTWDGIHFNIVGATFIGKQLASRVKDSLRI